LEHGNDDCRLSLHSGMAACNATPSSASLRIGNTMKPYHNHNHTTKQQQPEIQGHARKQHGYIAWEKTTPLHHTTWFGKSLA
jgi:hypothetical protein